VLTRSAAVALDHDNQWTVGTGPMMPAATIGTPGTWSPTASSGIRTLDSHLREGSALRTLRGRTRLPTKPSIAGNRVSATSTAVSTVPASRR
jgi:hypothetical protein